jgi:hypothetical protein
MDDDRDGDSERAKEKGGLEKRECTQEKPPKRSQRKKKKA